MVVAPWCYKWDVIGLDTSVKFSQIKKNLPFTISYNIPLLSTASHPLSTCLCHNHKRKLLFWKYQIYMISEVFHFKKYTNRQSWHVDQNKSAGFVIVL